jgi:hypothetical protein
MACRGFGLWMLRDAGYGVWITYDTCLGLGYLELDGLHWHGYGAYLARYHIEEYGTLFMIISGFCRL